MIFALRDNIIVKNGRVTKFFPYAYVIGRRPPRLSGDVEVEETDLTPMVFDGLRYVESSERVWQVYADSPQEIPKIREKLWKMGYKTSQCYIKFALRAAGDLTLGRNVPNPAAVVEEIPHVRPRILAVDVEVRSDGVYIGYTLGDDVVITRNPKDLEDIDYDFAVGYNSWGFDYQYLPVYQGSKYALKNKRGLKPLMDLYALFDGGYASSLSLTERALALYDVARQLGVHRQLGLSEVELLRVKSLRAKIDVLPHDVLERYLALDVMVTHKIAATAVPVLEAVGRMVGANAMVVNQLAAPPTPASPGHLVEFYVHKMFEAEGRVLQDTKRDAEYEAGEKVRVRDVGRYETVAEYDFRAMYPSLIAQDGIDPTSVRECADGFEVKTSKDSKRICFDGGPVRDLFDLLLETREKAKKISKTADQAVKIMANSGYGIFGKSGVGIVNIYIAAYIAQKTDAIHADLWNRYSPIYGDTDSLYVELQGRDPEKLLEEINGYVADRWRGPYGSRLQLKLEAVWNHLLIPPSKSGEKQKKNYVKIRGEEVVIKGGALSPRTLPAHLRYGKAYEWVRRLVAGEASLSDLFAELERVPVEALLVERSTQLRELFLVKSKPRNKDNKRVPLIRPITRFDGNRLPIVAYLVAKYGSFTAYIERDKVDISIKGLNLSDIINVYALELEGRGDRKEYVVLVGGRLYWVAFKPSVATIDAGGRKVVRASAVREAMREVAREEVMQIVKKKIASHPLFAYFAQGRLA